MLYILILALLFKASAMQLKGYGNAVVEYGKEGHYKCTVDNQTGVLQVTWQRLMKDEPIENLATYSQHFGQRVNRPYQGKVVFTQASLNSTSITLKNVSWQDEGCYICSFNVYPDGSKRKQTCLSVQGISSVDTQFHHRSGRDGEDVGVSFSCSATGKPAPTIEWDISPGATYSEQRQTVAVANSDHTFTISDNITLRLPVDWDGHVDCLLNTGRPGQRREKIPFVLERAEHPKVNDVKGLSPSGLAIIITAVSLISLIAAFAAATMWKRFKCNRMKMCQDLELY
ncbi:OX-2 membrane glycoprotein-like [Solea senegalensis]|uniref:OX-2 membrane glycoprotein-like n=1 Tax=Solea senegalensis TaxID=28829 RepID=A0AAV6R887_SOLSE|nr:OX-2 membrane glycoprotein-like [Solea senegalensis]KAG7501548.1 OX-2 membrane glycoprotein-like [Solea senegalensis]